MLVVMPRWIASPPASFALIQQNGQAEITFWIPVQIAFVILLILGLVLNWRTPRRKLLLVVLGGFVLVGVMTALYFAPEILELAKTPPDAPFSAELAARGNRWWTLTWIRIGIFAIANVFLLLALATPISESKQVGE